ncbi:DUF3080 domain-containing protein [Aliikangiella marina]|uniref:DUF3080 domain-containing protein n=1 Tax=Aliikangiella marina TaxID=1712262 RepID=A0A545THQ8_9GAMM|nr:DUF3080 family protein [Aliikangiella marina]TQV76764.1 DUF3080 domain-containing protein [Aliikangiella marina]
MMLPKIFAHSSVLLLSLMIVSGCAELNEYSEEITDYKQRIYTILNVQYLKAPPAAKQFPDTKELKRQLPTVRVDWLDFFSVTECVELQQLLGHRNSQLGRNMQAESLLHYEKRLSILLAQCVASIEAPSEKLLAAISAKRTQFSTQIWNNTWASRYWQKLFSYSNKHRAVGEQEMQALAQSFADLRKLLTSKQLPDNQQWFDTFQLIEQSSGLIGSLEAELVFHIDELQATTSQLNIHLHSICPNKQPTTEYQYLKNILNKFYLQDIQKRQVTLLNSFRGIQKELAQWSIYFPKDATGFYHWYDQSFNIDSSNHLEIQLKQAILDHVKTWQKLDQACKPTIDNR